MRSHKYAHNMNKPLKFLITCWTLAVGAFLTGQWYQAKLERELASTVAQCEAENAQQAARLKTAPDNKDKWWSGDPLLCDPVKLSEITWATKFQGVQGRITDLHAQVTSQEEKYFANGTAFALSLLALVPYLWQFFLRRLREVAGAVRGD